MVENSNRCKNVETNDMNIKLSQWVYNVAKNSQNNFGGDCYICDITGAWALFYNYLIYRPDGKVGETCPKVIKTTL